MQAIFFSPSKHKHWLTIALVLALFFKGQTVYGQKDEVYQYCVLDPYPTISSKLSNKDVTSSLRRVCIGSQNTTIISSEMASLMYQSLRMRAKPPLFDFELERYGDFFQINSLPGRITSRIEVADFEHRTKYGGSDVLVGRDVLHGHVIELDAFNQTFKISRKANRQDQPLSYSAIDFLEPISLIAGSATVSLVPSFSLHCGFQIQRSELERLMQNGAHVRFTGEYYGDKSEIVEMQNISISGIQFGSIWGLTGHDENVIGLPVLNRFKITLDMDSTTLLLTPNNFTQYRDHSFNDGMRVAIGEVEGATITFIETLIANSYAAKIGLLQGDVILSIDGESGLELISKLHSKMELMGMPRKRSIKIEVLRETIQDFYLPPDI